LLLLWCSGCLAISIASTTHEQAHRTQIDTRVTSRQADVSGQKCYVENKFRVESSVSEWRGRSSIARPFAALEMLFGGIVAGTTAPPDQYYWAGAAADGVLALAYALLRDDSVSTSEDWEDSQDTAPCRK
jgi:hypothetical protein